NPPMPTFGPLSAGAMRQADTPGQKAAGEAAGGDGAEILDVDAVVRVPCHHVGIVEAEGDRAVGIVPHPRDAAVAVRAEVVACVFAGALAPRGGLAGPFERGLCGLVAVDVLGVVVCCDAHEHEVSPSI